MKTDSSTFCDTTDIAIVGMACRYPGNVNSPKQFLRFLLDNGNGIIKIPPERWDIHSYYDADKTKPNRMYVKRGGFLSQIDQFDPLFFGISPKEAPHIDPQHRWLLEITQEAFENAGIKPSSIKGSDTAVYIGQFMHDYEQLLLDSNAHKNMTSHTATGPSMTLTANRISYLFDLTGPSVTLDTACSSSLVALDLACKAILNGDSHMAIAGGVNILLRPELTMSICAASMLSPDGYCKSFDESANGYVRSEGAGVVVVKPLRDAVEHGDPVLAVIKATAVNQDGQTLGITVPNGESQKKLLAASFQKAGVSPGDIQYAEAHGTGTAVGDPIEVNALGSLLRERDGEPCIIGSVKSNVGHMESAAGMAGLMKTVLAMNEGFIPGNLHFKKLNPGIDLKKLRLEIADQARPWPDTQGKPRRALVNSFGFGGTNSNVIVEERPIYEVGTSTRKPVVNNNKNLLPISAKSAQALADLVDSYIAFFGEIAESHSQNSTTLLHNICYTASLRRDHYKHRLVVLAESVDQFIDSLSAWREGKILPNVWSGTERTDSAGKICFVFSGMGTQWAGVGKELYDSEPVFKRELDRCDRALAPLTGWSLVEAIFNLDDKDAIHSTHIAQPVIFAIQIALAKLLQSWGVSPDFVVGHSAGEVAASYISGALSFEDAIQVIYHRSRLQHTTAGMGKMLAVGLPVSELPKYLSGWEDKVSIGAINSEDAITLAGDADALEAIAGRLDENDIFARFLKVDVPYHSPVMDQLKPALMDSLENIRPQKPHTRLFSTVSANETREGDWTAEYWFHNVREPVKFKSTIENIASCGVSAFIEIGPHTALASSIKSTLASNAIPSVIIATLKREQDAIVNIYETIAQLHTHNVLSPWEALYPQKGKVEALPNYAWQRASYWCEADEVRQARLKNTGFLGAFEEAQFPLLGGKLSSAHWLWQHQLDLNEFAYLRGHRVGNDIVYPGAAYVEMALSMAALFSVSDDPLHSGSFALERIGFHQALYLDNNKPVTIESSYDPATREFSINAPDSSAMDWTMHASGVIAKSAKHFPKKSLDLTAILDSMTEQRSGDLFYEHCRTLGLEYENAFKAIELIHVDGDRAVAEIEVSEQILREQQNYFLHPVILDTAFQTFFATVDLGYLPAGIQAIRYYRKPAGKCYSYYETLEATPARVVGNITLCDEQGGVLVEVFGIEVLAIQREEATSATNKVLTYEFDWMEQPLDTTKPSENGLWILIVGDKDLSRTVKAELEERKQKVCLVTYGETFTRNANNDFSVRPDSPEDLVSVFREHAGLSKGVIYLRDIGSTEAIDISAEDLCTVCENNAVSAVNLTRALTDIEFQLMQKVFLVSRDTQTVLSDADNKNLTTAGLWGFGRVLANEHPELQVCLVDLPTGDYTQSASLLVSEVLSGGDEQEVAYRNDVRYVHRLERLSENRLKKYTHISRRFTAGEAFKVSGGDATGNSWVFQRLAQPEPGNNDVVIKSEYSALVPRADGAAGDFACNIVVGRIAKTGLHAKLFNEQDLVIHFSTEAPQSYYCVRENNLVPLPHRSDPAKSVLFAAPHLLATTIFGQRLNLSPGSSVLVHQAGTPLGYAILGLAKKLGMHLFITVDNDVERARFTELGYSNVFNCDSYAYIRELKAAMPAGGFDAVLSGWHGELPGQVENFVADFGHLVTLVSTVNHSGTQLFRSKTESFSQHIICVGNFLGDVIRQINDGHKPTLEEMDTDLPAAIEPRCVGAEEYAQQFARPTKHAEWLVLDYAVTPATGIEGLADDFINSNRTYLVTGGLGGLGQQIMIWLAKNGAKSIVLLGRRKPDEEALINIEQLRSTHVSVEVIQVDVANIDEVERVVATIESSLPPLGGVIHSAGVLDDGVIVQQTAEKIRKVLAPKVRGAWNLHLATRHLPLDLFVCFSSIASIVGWAGQSNYAYANAFMDALAFYRRSRGLPGLTINWGPWADAGMAASLNDRDKQRMNQAGMFALATDQGLAGMAALLTHRITQAGVFDVEWSLIARQYPRPEKKTLLKHLIKIEAGASRQNFLEAFLKASSDVRESMLVTNVRQILAGVLGLDSPDSIDANNSIFDYGVNSLMAMELKNGIQNLVKQQLPTSLIMKNPSVNKIVAYILQLDFLNAELERKDAKNEVFSGPAPLTADQKNFFSWYKINPQWGITNHYFETSETFDAEKLNQAVNHVCKLHDSLRARFYQTGDGWAQRLVLHEDYAAVAELDWRHLKSKTELLSQLNDYAQEKSLAHKLDSDPLIRITIVHYGTEGKILVLFSLHHLALDGYSIQILTGDILSAYQQLLEGKPVTLPPQTTPVRDWIAALGRLVNADEFRPEIDYWKSLPLEDACSVPVDYPENLTKRVIRAQARYESELSRELSTSIMRTFPQTRNIKSFDIFLTAFLVTISEWKDSSSVAFLALDNGRGLLSDNDEIDLSRTIGWLSMLSIIFLNRPTNFNLSELVEYVSREIQNLSNGGTNLELLTAYHDDPAVQSEMRALPRPKFLINYAGNPLRNDKLGVKELEGYNWINWENQTPWYQLVSVNEVNGVVHIYWDYNTVVHKEETILKLARRFDGVLGEIVASIEKAEPDTTNCPEVKEISKP